MCLGRQGKSVGSASEVPAGALCVKSVDLRVDARGGREKRESVNHISQRALQLQQQQQRQSARHKDGDEEEERKREATMKERAKGM